MTSMYAILTVLALAAVAAASVLPAEQANQAGGAIPHKPSMDEHVAPQAVVAVHSVEAEAESAYGDVATEQFENDDEDIESAGDDFYVMHDEVSAHPLDVPNEEHASARDCD